MGRSYEEFEVGQRFKTARRTVIEADIGAFAGLTGDFNPLHMDEAFAAESDYKGRITHGPMIVGMAFGLASRADVMDGTVLALLEIGWKFVKPVRPGDTHLGGLHGAREAPDPHPGPRRRHVADRGP